MKRRDIIKSLSVLPFAGGILGTIVPFESIAKLPGAKRNLFQELGVRTFINAAGTYTFMTGSLMQEEVVDAIRNSSKDFCLQKAIGIASYRCRTRPINSCGASGWCIATPCCCSPTAMSV